MQTAIIDEVTITRESGGGWSGPTKTALPQGKEKKDYLAARLIEDSAQRRWRVELKGVPHSSPWREARGILRRFWWSDVGNGS